MKGMAERRRGRRPLEQMALSEAQQEQVLRAMVGRNPDQLELGEGKLWSRGAVRALIFKLCGVELSRQTVGRYLRLWGWSKKKPSRRWLQQDPARVKAWLEKEYPAIKARAQSEGAKILWADEMGLRAGQTSGTSYAPVGERAIVAVTGKRFAVNVISAIGNDGTLLFEVIDGYGNEITFMDFCDKLIEHHGARKVFLIVDNAKLHKSIAVQAFEEDHPELEIFYLPPYAPEHNPDEYLNNDVHSHVARKRPDTKEELLQMTISYLRTRTAQIVRNYFNAPLVQYAG
jgi:transposase